MITLGATLCIRNGDALDFCWRESALSLLPVCDSLTICDGESTDGTQEAIREWMQREPKIKLCVYPWPDPKGDPEFLVKWLNYARDHLETDFNFSLDADEVLSEQSYPEIERFKHFTKPHYRISLRCQRHNFWGNTRTLIPPGHCLGHKVIRVAPQSVWMPSDGAHPLGHEISSMAIDSGLELYHYGFLRKREAYFDKSRQLHTMFFGGYTDPRMHAVEKVPGNWMEKIERVEWINDLVPFTKPHPQVAHAWLRERGWDVS